MNEFQLPMAERLLEVEAETTEHIANKEYSDVLLIVTGGTFCMVQTTDGYVPAKGLANRLKDFKTFYDKEESLRLGVDKDTLVTPPSAYKSRIRFKVLEFDDLIDSSNIDLGLQTKIARVIESNYKDYDGFVVCHGTDTMAYTASTLSFMFENIRKTIVITGS